MEAYTRDAGDFADLRALVALKQRYGFLLVVDDAHGTLVCGPRCALNVCLMHCLACLLHCKIYRPLPVQQVLSIQHSCFQPAYLWWTGHACAAANQFAGSSSWLSLTRGCSTLAQLSDQDTRSPLRRGEGVAAAQGVTSGIDICVGTLSKAFGAHGGFVALSAPCKRLLLNRGRSYVFSTALPVPIVAGALAALKIAVDEVSCWCRLLQYLALSVLAK